MNDKKQVVGLRVAAHGKVWVKREGGHDTKFKDIETGVLNAPQLLCTFGNPNASPQFKHQTPAPLYYNEGDIAGKVIGNKRAIYDPQTGIVRLFVEANSLNPMFNEDEEWQFEYTVLKYKYAHRK